LREEQFAIDETKKNLKKWHHIDYNGHTIDLLDNQPAAAGLAFLALLVVYLLA